MNLTKTLISRNFSYGRTSPIKEITIHHTAGTITLPNLYNWFNRANGTGSSHYAVREDAVCQFVEESNTAWTNSVWLANCRAVTIETVNSAANGKWPISDYTYATLIELVYDIAQRNKLLPIVKGISLTYHSMYANTSCPGAYLLERIDDIVNRVNAKAGGKNNNTATTTCYRVRKSGNDSTSQKGAFNILDNAIKLCNTLNETSDQYSVYNENGFKIYPKD